MPHYMVQFAYSADAWQALMRKPEDRTAALESLAKQSGGRLVSVFYHFGEFDGTVVFEAPDDATVNAIVMAVLGSGALRASRTTRLFTPKEVVEALGRAGKIVYASPTSGKK